MSITTIERRQLAYDTAANWTAQNPILAMAEEGYETDTGKRKIGDGATAWNSLAYGADASKSPLAGPGSSQAFAVGALTSVTAAATGGISDTLGVGSFKSNWFAFRTYNTGTAVFALDTYTGSAWQNTLKVNTTNTIEAAGAILPTAHNTYDLGATSVRWKDLWLQSGAFNGSDARLKTVVQPMTTAEITAATQLSKEIGTYQWLQSVAEKGSDKARLHTGLTVQRAIEIMTENGLDWTRYAFIGYDQWDDKIVEHPEILAQEATEETEAVEYQPAWTETVLKAGDAYSFRYDQLNMFITRGFEARLAALEAL